MNENKKIKIWKKEKIQQKEKNVAMIKIDETILRFFKNRPDVTAGYFYSILMFPIGLVVVPAILGKMLDKIKDGKGIGEWGYQLLIILILFGVLLSAHVVSLIIDSYISSDMMRYMRQTIVQKVIEAHSYNYSSLQVSDIITKLQKLPKSVFAAVHRWKETIIPGAITLIAVNAYLYSINVYAGIGISLIVLFLVLGMWWSYKVNVEKMVALDYAQDIMFENVGDMLDNLMQVCLADASEKEFDKLEKEQKKLRDFNMRSHLQVAAFTVPLKLLLAMGVIGVLIISWKQYQQGKISSGQLVALLFILMCSRQLIFSILLEWPRLLEYMALVGKTERYLNRQHEKLLQGNKERTSNVSVESTPFSIVFDHVMFSYPGATSPILNDVSFTIPKGVMVHIHGHIGSGKSTIAKLCAGLAPYDSGSVKVNGFEVSSANRTVLTGHVTYVPQNPQMLNRTVYENMCLGNNATREQVQAAMDACGITFCELDDNVGKHGNNLSTGQRVMLHIARSVLLMTPILICDEVTSNMDDATTKSVLDVIRAATLGRTLLFISHDKVDLPFSYSLTLSKGTISK